MATASSVDGLRLPRDENDKVIHGVGTAIGTEQWTSVNATTGQAISFSVACQTFEVSCQDGAEWEYKGTVTGHVDWVVCQSASKAFAIAAPASTTVLTVRSKSGNTSTFDVTFVK